MTNIAPTLLQALNLEAFPPEQQEEMLLTLSNLVFRASLVRLIEQMDDNTRVEFSALMKNNASPEAVEDFLKERLPGATGAVRDTVTELTADMMALDIPQST